MTFQFLFRIRTLLLAVLALVGYPLFFVCAARRTRIAGNMRPRILIIPQLTRIGDVICTTPVFCAVKRRYPDCFLSVLVTPQTFPILKNNPHIDELLLFEHSEHREFFGLFRLFKKIRDRRFDWSVNIAASTFGTVATVCGCVPRRVKITRRGRPTSEMLSDWMNRFRIRYHSGEYLPALYLKTLSPLDVSLPENIVKEVFTTPDGDRKAARFLRTHVVVPDDMVVGISVSAGNKIKEWELPKWKQFVKCISERYPIKIVFIGTETDRKQIDEVNAYINSTGVNAAGAFSLEELPSLMKRFSVFVAADSGTIHIADALNIPLIDIVGPVDPAEQAPSDEKSFVVKPPSHIEPTIFALRPPGDEKESRRAVESISVDNVMEAFEKLYARIMKH